MVTLRLSFACGESSLRVHRFSVSESVSSLFKVSVVACSSDPHVDIDALIGQPAAFHIATGYQFVAFGGMRCWEGICCRAEQTQALDPASGLSTYALRIVPALWLLTQRQNYRVFQHLSVPEIADKLLSEWGIEPVWRIDRDDHPRLEYRVQYDESDYNLLSRVRDQCDRSATRHRHHARRQPEAGAGAAAARDGAVGRGHTGRRMDDRMPRAAGGRAISPGPPNKQAEGLRRAERGRGRPPGQEIHRTAPERTSWMIIKRSQERSEFASWGLKSAAAQSPSLSRSRSPRRFPQMKPKKSSSSRWRW